MHVIKVLEEYGRYHNHNNFMREHENAHTSDNSYLSEPPPYYVKNLENHLLNHVGEEETPEELERFISESFRENVVARGQQQQSRGSIDNTDSMISPRVFYAHAKKNKPVLYAGNDF